MELIARNVVLAAQRFNPSIISQLWLVKNNILSEESFLEGCLFADFVSQVNSRDFSMLVVPEMLQFSPELNDEEQEAELVAQKVGDIARALPHTPYTAIGLNFVWHQTLSEEGVSEVTRRLFFRPESPLFRNFDTPNARFGSYLSRDFDNMRLKLDIKPVQVSERNDREHRIQFSFNFHRGLTSDQPLEDIAKVLNLWSRCKIESKSIVGNTGDEGITNGI